MTSLKRTDYVSPASREVPILTDRNFLDSGDFGDGGYPGKDLDLGDEYDF